MSRYFVETPTRECDDCGKAGVPGALCAACEVKSWKARGLCHDCGGFVFKGAKQCSLCREDEDLDVAIGRVFQPGDTTTDPLSIRQRMSHELAFSGASGNRMMGGDL